MPLWAFKVFKSFEGLKIFCGENLLNLIKARLKEERSSASGVLQSGEGVLEARRRRLGERRNKYQARASGDSEV